MNRFKAWLQRDMVRTFPVPDVIRRAMDENPPDCNPLYGIRMSAWHQRPSLGIQEVCLVPEGVRITKEHRWVRWVPITKMVRDYTVVREDS